MEIDQSIPLDKFLKRLEKKFEAHIYSGNIAKAEAVRKLIADIVKEAVK